METAEKFVEGAVMAKLIYDKRVTALVVIDPYNDFISEGGNWICSSRRMVSISSL